ncbi:MAG: hypothetical protein COT73_04040 [Bdellovibrio sp. CG10_big_fil_rev_8_21_14_0_10_47_8]|nr:MAG: hypothetical protein COT73_04040 [Bdellovibrio sp. CG10_big_fil_rev_8_21_14_0_10_47_8]
MKNILIICFAMLLGQISTASVSAVSEMQRTSFILSRMTGPGEHTYYNCDYVESFVRGMLNKLGAEDVRVHCTGGIDNTIRRPMPATVSARFSSARSTNVNNSSARAADYKVVTLRASRGCSLANDTYRAIADKFELETLMGPGFCNSSDAFHIEARVLKFQQ